MADMGAGTGTTTATKHLTLRCQFCETWNRIDAARAADRPKCGKCAKPMLLDRPFPLNDDTFSRTIEGAEVPVLVDFYADWCGPCKVMAPAVDDIAATYQGRALVAKLPNRRDMASAWSACGNVPRWWAPSWKLNHQQGWALRSLCA